MKPFERLDCGAMEWASCRASHGILFQETRELVPIEPPPVCPQAGEKFEFVACENRHKNAGMPKSSTTSGPIGDTRSLHLLHSSVFPAAVRANINSRPHTLRFRCQTRLETVRPLAGPAKTRGRISAAGVGDRGPPHCHPVSIRAPSIRRRATLAVHL